MSSSKKYWKSVEELKENNSIVETLKQNEFVEKLPVDTFLEDKETLESSSTTRRDFLKYIGFSTAAASLAACEGPVKKSIPYVVQPTEIVPGVANYYATTIADGYDFANILIKTREGRPIKVENNTLAGSSGIANARVNASVLGLYDSLRLKSPEKNGSAISWSTFQRETKIAIEKAISEGKRIVFLTQTFASPSTEQLIADFSSKYPNTSHVIYDAISYSEALDAYQQKYGKRGLADYDFSKAMTIVSIGADFLGDWQGGGFDSGYAKNRIPHHGKMSRHIQFESNMSLSGANADKRVALTPMQQKIALVKLYGYISGTSVSANLPKHIDDEVKKAASQLKKSGSEGVVVSGIQDVNAQRLVFEINNILSSKAFKPETPIMTRQGNDARMSEFVLDMNTGQVGAVIMCGVNPVYTLSNSKVFLEGLKKVDLTVNFSMKADETSVACQYVGAAPHYLESWGDVEFKKGYFSLIQPTIRPLFDTKQFQDCLLQWVDDKRSYHDYIKAFWNANVLEGFSFNKALHDGIYIKANNSETTEAQELENEVSDASNITSNLLATIKSVPNTFELELYSKTGMGDGQQANNPWLQEFPDPISRVSWDNYLTMSQADASDLGLINKHVANGALNGSYAKVSSGNLSVTVPVLIQPGQAKGSVGLAFGYGKQKGLKTEMQTGVSAYTLYKDFKNVQSVTIESVVGGEHEFASVQLHNTLMGRGDIVKETTLEIFNTKDKTYWNPVPKVSLNHQETPVTSPDVDLWDEFDRSIGHHFNLSIDLNACTGCGACVIACHAENNVPVVGKSEVRRSRDMHWLRIDRYYSHEDAFSGDNENKESLSGLFGDTGSLKGFGKLESASENPQVVFQPVMCQHCNHAPCETVCPVAATSHGRQGQNHMAYNRCVGTRYCANNCPYKVRRFNWFLYNGNDEFDYHMNDDLGRMVLNPDVVVRSRGVMEKCSMCIQKTQKTILDAKREGRKIKDGEFQTACSAACGTGAMVFGDINDKHSEVTALKKDNRTYHLLEHVGTKPNVMYQTKVRNTTEA